MTLSLVNVGGSFYIILDGINDDIESALSNSLGEYYDMLIEYVVYDNYSYVNDYGREVKYATIAVEDVFDSVFMEDN